METLLKFIENDEQELIQSQRQIQAEIRNLKETEQIIQDKLDDYFLIKARKNIGRCFKINSYSFGKIIDVPKRIPKLDGTFSFNRYQYPAIIIYTNTTEDTVLFDEDYIFLDKNDDSQYKEIPLKEFTKIFNNCISNFQNNINSIV
ncbi:MAG: hypothetical protein SPI36_02210 [Candidatus Onthovivens sp.]|nr:hypothetical protein [Candidatus Onthovivens sp.]